jgi:hypothetical protein
VYGPKLLKIVETDGGGAGNVAPRERAFYAPKALFTARSAFYSRAAAFYPGSLRPGFLTEQSEVVMTRMARSAFSGPPGLVCLHACGLDILQHPTSLSDLRTYKDTMTQQHNDTMTQRHKDIKT